MSLIQGQLLLDGATAGSVAILEPGAMFRIVEVSSHMLRTPSPHTVWGVQWVLING